MKGCLPLVVACLLAMPCLCRAQGVSLERIRTLLKPPDIQAKSPKEFGFVLSINEEHMWRSPDAQTDPRVEIARLQKSLKGNENDARVHFAIGSSYAEVKEYENSKAHFTRAAILYQQLLAKRPKDVRLMLQLGEALLRAGKDDEAAEATLRRVTHLAPDLWQGWAMLGKTINEKAFIRLLINASGMKNPAELSNYRFTMATFMSPDWKAPRETIDEAARLQCEARRYIDQAVQLAPNLPQPYEIRWCSQFLNALVTVMNEAATSPKQEYRTTHRAPLCFFAGALSDARKVAALRPDDPDSQYRRAWNEALSEVRDDLDSDNQEEFWNALSEPTRQAVRESLARLAAISEGRDRKKAALAAEYSGNLQVLINNPLMAEERYRRAIALDPSRDEALEHLVGLLSNAERFADVAAVLRNRVAFKDSARYRFMLAKVCERLNQPDQAETELRAALKVDPKDFNANLAWGIALLKRGAKAEEAQPFIEKALAALPSGSDAAAAHTAIAVVLALEGKRAQAKQELESAQKFDGNYQPAKDIAKELGLQIG